MMFEGAIVMQAYIPDQFYVLNVHWSRMVHDMLGLSLASLTFLYTYVVLYPLHYTFTPCWHWYLVVYLSGIQCHRSELWCTCHNLFCLWPSLHHIVPSQVTCIFFSGASVWKIKRRIKREEKHFSGWCFWMHKRLMPRDAECKSH